jgi:hypothetical protein
LQARTQRRLAWYSQNKLLLDQISTGPVLSAAWLTPGHTHHRRSQQRHHQAPVTRQMRSSTTTRTTQVCLPTRANAQLHLCTARPVLVPNPFPYDCLFLLAVSKLSSSMSALAPSQSDASPSSYLRTSAQRRQKTCGNFAPASSAMRVAGRSDTKTQLFTESFASSVCRYPELFMRVRPLPWSCATRIYSDNVFVRFSNFSPFYILPFLCLGW